MKAIVLYQELQHQGYKQDYDRFISDIESIIEYAKENCVNLLFNNRYVNNGVLRGVVFSNESEICWEYVHYATPVVSDFRLETYISHEELYLDFSFKITTKPDGTIPLSFPPSFEEFDVELGEIPVLNKNGDKDTFKLTCRMSPENEPSSFHGRISLGKAFSSDTMLKYLLIKRQISNEGLNFNIPRLNNSKIAWVDIVNFIIRIGYHPVRSTLPLNVSCEQWFSQSDYSHSRCAVIEKIGDKEWYDLLEMDMRDRLEMYGNLASKRINLDINDRGQHYSFDLDFKNKEINYSNASDCDVTIVQAKRIKWGAPKLEFALAMPEGQQIDMKFMAESNKVTMKCGFLVKPVKKNEIPMLLSDVEIKMHFTNDDGSEVIKDLTIMPNDNQLQTLSNYQQEMGRSQKFLCSVEWHNNDIKEFLSLRNAIEKGKVHFSWAGTNKCAFLSAPLECMGDLNLFLLFLFTSYNEEKIQKNWITGIINIPDGTDCKYMFDGVKNVDCWDDHYLNENKDKLVYKIPLEGNAMCILPQEYRIGAEPSNAPAIETISVKEGDTHKILTRIRITPYVHPNAKRDAYDIYSQINNKKYCELKYSGFESADFRYDNEMAGGNLYGPGGFESITREGEVEAAPGTCFSIVLKTPTDGLVDLFHDQIMNKGIDIGNVVFTVKNGDEKKDLKVPVKLNLHKLSGIQPAVKVLEYQWPEYRLMLTNVGQYPIEIGGLALSVLHHSDNDDVTDAEHRLKWKNEGRFILPPDESKTIELTHEQVENLKRLNDSGNVDIGYWDEFICEPYSIRLQDDTLKQILNTTNDRASYGNDTWTLTVMKMFNWDDFPGLIVQIELKNQFGPLPSVILEPSGDERPKVSMVQNLGAEMSTRNAGDRVFEYRLTAITEGGAKQGEWRSGSTDILWIYKNDIDCLFNDNK